VIEKLRTSWRSYREKRREYQLERALYKAGGHRGARHGGFDSGVMKEPEDLSRIPPTAPGGP
jgi:hypothetical protein